MVGGKKVKRGKDFKVKIEHEVMKYMSTDKCQTDPNIQIGRYNFEEVNRFKCLRSIVTTGT